MPEPELFEELRRRAIEQRTPHAFAAKTMELLADPAQAAALAHKARRHVVADWDMAAITRKLAASYREVIAEKRDTRA